MQVEEMPIEAIKPYDNNPRRNADEKNILQHGVS